MSENRTKGGKGKRATHIRDTTASDLIEFARSVAEQERSAHVLAGHEADADNHERVVGIQRGFVLVLAHHKAPLEVLRSFVQGSYAYLYASESVFFKRSKFLTAFFMSRYLRNETPEAPSGATFKLVGPFRRWIRARLTKFSKQNTHLFFSLVQVKRSALPASESIILENAMKHRDAMVKACSLDQETVDELIGVIRPLLNAVKNSLENDLDSRRVASFIRSDAAVDSVHQSSRSASVWSTRREGGQAGALARMLGIETEAGPSTRTFVPYSSGFNVDEDVCCAPCDLSGTEIGESENTDVAGFTFSDRLFDVTALQPDVVDKSGQTVRELAAIAGIPLPTAADLCIPPNARFSEICEMEVESGRLDSKPVDVAEMRWQPAGVQAGVRKENVTQTVFTDFDNLELWSDIRQRALEEPVDVEIDNCGNPRVQPEKAVEARTAFVVEPLKVRTVSAGPPATYYVTTLFQRSVHTCLRQMSPFRLTGRPASATDLLDLRHATAEFLGEHRQNMDWFSADYVASTDNLERPLSTAIMNELTSGLPADLRAIFSNSLKPHYVHYPGIEAPKSFEPVFRAWLAKAGWTNQRVGLDKQSPRIVRRCLTDADKLVYTVPPCLQVNAQLMGSNSSFVILCIANFALYMLTMKRWWTSTTGKQWSHALYRYFSSKVLINGDDLLTCLTPDAEKIFRQLGDRVGLSMSVGKTYRHRFYANINSTSYHLDAHGSYVGDKIATLTDSAPRERITLEFDEGVLVAHSRRLRPAAKIDYTETNSTDSSTPVCIEYLNTGLLVGQNKVMASVDVDASHIESFGQAPKIVVINRVLAGSLPGRSCRLFADYISLHRDDIKSQARGRNLFVSLSLGGWGVKVPDAPSRSLSWRWRLTERQAAEAQRRYEAIAFAVVKAEPGGTRLQEVDAAKFVEPWSFRDELKSSVTYLGAVDRRMRRLGFDCTVEYESRYVRHGVDGVPDQNL